jgi:hypothetical protein
MTDPNGTTGERSQLPSNNPDQLSPEARQRLEAAMQKIRNNPGLLNMIGGMAGVAKIANQFGITKVPPEIAAILSQLNQNGNQSPLSGSADITTISASTTSANSNSAGTFTPSDTSVRSGNQQIYREMNRQRNFSPTFNPAVKGDGFRKFIFVTVMLGLIGYLLFRYGFAYL